MKRFVAVILVVTAVSAVTIWISAPKPANHLSLATDAEPTRDESNNQLPTRPIGRRQPQADPTPQAYEIIFPDGDVLEVRLYAYRSNFDTSVSDLSDSYHGLLDLARAGDTDAAYKLGTSLRSCKGAFKSNANLQLAIDSLISNYSYKTPEGERIEYSVDGPGLGVATEVERLRTQFKSCRDITPQQVSEANEWIGVAAESGNLAAALEIANGLAPGLEKLEAFERVWSLGEPNGLGWLSVALRDGWPGVKPDAVRSYAMALAHFELGRLVMKDRYGSVSPGFREQEMLVILDRQRSQLSHDQEFRAVELAKELIIQNQNCCVGKYR